jgi:cell division protein FtsL
MRELTTFEQRVLMQLENLEKENATLLRRSRIDRIKLHNLEMKILEMEDVMSFNDIN